MQDIIRIIIGILVLALGIPVGNWLSKITKEEMKAGQIWFKIIILVCLVGAVFALVLGEDVLLFELLFIAIVTSRSLRGKKGKKK